MRVRTYMSVLENLKLQMPVQLRALSGLFDNWHGKWNMQDIKKIGLTIGLFTCVQNKVYIYIYIYICSKLGTSMFLYYDTLKILKYYKNHRLFY